MNRFRTTFCITLGVTAAFPATAQVSMEAATAVVNGRPQVRVRWTLDSGWLPKGGFRLYKLAGTDRKPIYSSPASAAAGTQSRSLLRSIPGSYDFASALALADTELRDAADRSAPLFESQPTRPASSAAVFDALRASTIRARSLPGPGLASRDLSREIQNDPAVQQYRQRIRSTPPGTRALPTDSERVRSARADLLAAAMTRREVSAALGLGFDDTEVTAGARYGYALHTVEAAGQESPRPVAVVQNVTVGADPQPAAPTGFKAMQGSEDSVNLRWDRLTLEQEQRAGIASYNIYRLDPGAAAPRKLNPQPVVIADLETPSGPLEPIYFFRDAEVGPGAFNYRVSLVDMFGRESAPATLAFTVEDWRTPAPVVAAHASLRDGRPSIQWVASESQSVRYKVYRSDPEQPGQAPQLITPTPIPGEPLTPLEGQDPKRPLSQVIATSIRRFVDAAAPKDRYLQYSITALYSANNRESSAVDTAVVPVPADSPPSAPSELKAVFTASTRPTASTRSYVAARGVTRQISEARERDIANDSGAKPIAPVATAPVDAGGIVTITWAPGPKETTYRILRAAGKLPAAAPQAFTAVGRVESASSFADMLSRSQALDYSYRVIAVNRWGMESAPAEVGVRAPSTIPPSAPVLLSVTPDRQGRILLSVRANADSEEVVRYRIYRKALSPQAAAAIKPAWEDKLPPVNRPAGTVAARPQINPGGASPQSRPGSRGIPTDALSPESDAGYVEAGAFPATAKDAAGKIALADANVDPSQHYFYRIVAENMSGLRSERSAPLGAAPIDAGAAAASGVAAIAGPKGVEIRWSALKDAEGYIVRRAPAVSGEFRQVSGQVTGPSFVDGSALPGRSYRYEVIALDKAGNLSTGSPANGGQAVVAVR